jgi:hypothetical protein
MTRADHAGPCGVGGFIVDGEEKRNTGVVDFQ